MDAPVKAEGGESPPAQSSKPPVESSNAAKEKKKAGREPKEKKDGREYLGWEDAIKIEWRRDAEWTGYKKWRMKFGPCTEWMDRYEQWICSGTGKGVMRKPSYRALEWVKYQRGIEVSPVGESCTRRRENVKDWFVEPIEDYCCRPCPWPKLTSGEVGWLGQHRSCLLERYPNDFKKKPPLPSFDRKISTYPPGIW